MKIRPSFHLLGVRVNTRFSHTHTVHHSSSRKEINFQIYLKQSQNVGHHDGLCRETSANDASDWFVRDVTRSFTRFALVLGRVLIPIQFQMKFLLLWRKFWIYFCHFFIKKEKWEILEQEKKKKFICDEKFERKITDQ